MPSSSRSAAPVWGLLSRGLTAAHGNVLSRPEPSNFVNNCQALRQSTKRGSAAMSANKSNDKSANRRHWLGQCLSVAFACRRWLMAVGLPMFVVVALWYWWGAILAVWADLLQWAAGPPRSSLMPVWLMPICQMQYWLTHEASPRPCWPVASLRKDKKHRIWTKPATHRQEHRLNGQAKYSSPTAPLNQVSCTTLRARVNEAILKARALARALTGGGPAPSLQLYQFPNRKI